MSVYENCPAYQTERFRLRLVRMEDAEALLPCYSDPAAVANMNADCCTSDFYYTTLEQMRDCIGFWLESYLRGDFVRFAVEDGGDAVGTVELFGDEYGVLRIDLPTRYEDEQTMRELIRLAMKEMVPDFPMGRLCIKAGHAPARKAAALSLGFVPSESFRPGMGYLEWQP